jgi:methylated-DNA-[protein]-cysteine S-methyltransferase
MNKFEQKVYKAVNGIQKGMVVSYKDIALFIGNKYSYRAIGNALHNNPNIIKTPCHRVVNDNGDIGGYRNGKNKKKELLIQEGVIIINNRIDMKKYRYILKK